MAYTTPTVPSLRDPLASRVIRDEFGKVANEFALSPPTLGGGIRGFQGGQWDNALLNTPTIYRGQLGTNTQPCTYIGTYCVIAASAFTTLGVGNAGFVRGVDGKFKMMDGARVKSFWDNSHNFVMGGGDTENATTASTGFFYPPTTNGVATGAPANYVGACPMVVDRAAKKIGLYIAGAWVWTAALT